MLSLLACCGAPSESLRASNSQMALAATVAAAPTQAVLATAIPAATTTPVQAATNAPTLVPSTAVPTQPQPTKVATRAATLTPTTAPTPIPPTAAPPTAAPAAAAPQIDCASPCSISFAELYSGASITGPILSDKARALSGQKVIMRGFMAPPLSPSTTFFVLTKDPLVYCPFCNTAADWPFDIVYVKMAGGAQIPTMVPTTNLAVTGTFEVGTWADPETGFVSLIRIIADNVQPI